MLKISKKKKFIKLNRIKFFNRTFLNSKRFVDVLRQIYGINYFVAYHLVKMICYSFDIKIFKIKNYFLFNISDFLINYLLVDRGLKKYNLFILNEKKESGHFSLYRLIKGLPVNGQRTHSNARTVRKFFLNNDQTLI